MSPRCPHCQHTLSAWRALLTWRYHTLSCPYCQQTLRINRPKPLAWAGATLGLLTGLLCAEQHPDGPWPAIAIGGLLCYVVLFTALWHKVVLSPSEPV